jgi:MoxR-like ATPase
VPNPFADLVSFEALRAAALEGDQAYERYRRREAAAERRHVGRTVELQLSARVRRMVEVAIASSRAVLLVGPPGTGKTEIIEQVVDKIDRDPARFGFTSEGIGTYWVTPDEEWTFEKLVLGETVVNNEIQSVEGDLLQAIRQDQWLILDETNRADMDRVLGGVLTWLSDKRVKIGNVRLPGQDVVPAYLDWVEQPESDVREVQTPPSVEYVAGSDWRVLGTYNAVDAQRVFRMGQALSRRFKHVPVPPASREDFSNIIAGHVVEESLLEWLTDRVTRLYSAHLDVEDAQLGPGLFVDIPAYVEKGLRMAAYDRAESVEELAVDANQDDFEDPTPAEATGEIDEALPVTEEPPAQEPVAGAAPHVEDAAAANVEDAAATNEHDHSLREELLAEAYLVSVGNVIAKYEPDLLDDLSRGIIEKQALTPTNWAWVKESLYAMRA